MYQIIIELDMLANALAGGRRDMTISARIGLSLEMGCACWFARALARFLDIFETDHCRVAYRQHHSIRS